MAFKYSETTQDITFDNSKHVVLASKLEDVKQRLFLKLDLVRGEWFLNKSEGFPWLEIFSLTGEEQLSKTKEEVKKVLLADKAVKEIEKLEVKRENDNLVINFSILTTTDNEYTMEIIRERSRNVWSY